MTLLLKREPSQPWGTRGRLFLDGEPECLTLEDVVRDGPKILHETAIPSGRYRVVIDYSQRFGRMMPHLLKVPGFEGIRIHSGNHANPDSSGCILVGLGRSADGITRSREAMDRLMSRLALPLAKGEQVWLEILDAPAGHDADQTGREAK